MTTSLTSEPLPDDGQVPFMSELAHRLYHRLPEVYRTMDARDRTWVFKRYVAAVVEQAGVVDETIERIAGDNPVGPATPEPVGLPADELDTWRASRLSRLSALGDPQQADASWLPWLAQLVGARLDPNATLAEQRDTITFATSGYRAGTRSAIADAARSALTGSRYAEVFVHVKPDPDIGLIAGTPWDITIVTRASETPDPDAVLGAITRKGVKPAGAKLWARTYEATWATIQAQFPMWLDWNSVTWSELQEAGLTYASVPDNLAVNPSFETDTTGWSGLGGATLSRVAGGADGAWRGRITSTDAGATSGMISSAAVGSINDERTYILGMSVRPNVAVSGAALRVEWRDAGNVVLSTTSVGIDTLTVGTWNRATTEHLAPVGAVSAFISIVVGTMAVAAYCDVDAVLLRLT